MITSKYTLDDAREMYGSLTPINRLAIARRPGLPETAYRYLASDDSEAVRHALANNPDVSPHTLYAMHLISSPKVKAQIAKRPLVIPISKLLIVGGGYQDVGDTGVHCPLCGFGYVHPAGVRRIAGNGNGEAGWDGRGDLLANQFECENGHDFEICFGFHKGNVQAFARLILPPTAPKPGYEPEDELQDSLTKIPLATPDPN